MGQVHNSPSYQQALCTLLNLVRKYVAKASEVFASLAGTDAQVVTPVIWVDPLQADFLHKIVVIISRCAHGRSLDHWIQCLHAIINDLSNLPAELTHESDERIAFRSLVSEMGLWFDTALARPQYATSSEGHHKVEALYDRARTLLQGAPQSDRPYARHLRDLVLETGFILDAMLDDTATTRLLDRLGALSTSFSAYTEVAIHTVPRELKASQRRIRQQVQRDLLQWLLPRILRALHAVPMPRVEYTSGTLDAAVDSMYLTPTSAQLSLVPDHIIVENRSELRLDMVETNPGHDTDSFIPAESEGMKTYTRTRVRVDGIRISARNVGYYICYRFFGRSRWLHWLGYEDEGLISVDMGERGAKGEGLKVDVELEFNSNGDEEPSDQPLFTVKQVHVDVPGLQVSLDRTKHWLLNKVLLQPLSGPTGRAAAAWVLRGQLESYLDSLGHMAGNVSRAARGSAHDTHKDPELSDYAHAFWQALGNTISREGVEVTAEEDPNEGIPFIETHTSATTKGIVRTTVVYPDTPADDEALPSPIEETTFALGVGAQILPGKAGPYESDGSQQGVYGTRELARDALDQVQARVDEMMDAEEAAVQRGAEARDNVTAAARREQQREHREVRKAGWRSNAFDY